MSQENHELPAAILCRYASLICIHPGMQFIMKKFIYSAISAYFRQ